MDKGDCRLYETNNAYRDNLPTPTAHTELPKPKAKSRRGTQTEVTSVSVADTYIRPSKEIIYESAKREPVREDDDDDDDDYDDEFLEEYAKRFGRENVCLLAQT